MSSPIKTLRNALLCLTLALAAPTARADEAASLRAGLDLVAAKDWQGALSVAQDAGPTGGDIILWHWLRASEGKLGDYETFLARRPDWPGMPLLKEKGEVAVARSTDPARVVAYFGTDKPRSGVGAVALVGALLALGQQTAAEEEAFRAWTTLKFAESDEAALLALVPEALSLAHDLRLDRLLWDGERTSEAKRMLPRVSADYRALAEARLALRALQTNAPTLTEAVPAALAADAGLAFERFMFRMRKDRYDDARALILERSDSAASLGQPEAWAERRASLARYLMRNGEPKNAYRVASSHHLTEGDDFADLEFLAGFVALRKLENPSLALPHFMALKAAVATPISLARADYWIGRTHDALGDGAAAEAAFRSAAKHQTAYYGLLASQKLGLDLDARLISTAPPAGNWKTSGFANSAVLDAALRLVRVGDRTLAKRFFLHLGESLNDEEMAQLAQLVLDLNEPHIAVLIGKAAAERGLILPNAYYPAPDMVPDGLPVSRALALAISRRESEFDPAAQSKAGARGLMQVMPATAEKVAERLGETSSAGRLISDPPFNVRMGSAYLREMADLFGPSVALIASGYNAGPGRPRKWIAEFGDPRTGEVDIVDWVETIPFTETRTYVMRVSEGVVIYRAKLKGAVGPVNITGELIGN